MDIEDQRDLLRRTVLGEGLACEEILPGLDLGRDLKLAKGPNGLDFVRVEGMDNLAQSLAIALTTRLGDDVFNSQFGFDGVNALAEETDPILMRERIRIAIIRLLCKDRRVRRIVDVNLSGDGRLEPQPAGSRELQVRVAFETVAGEPAAVSLGKVMLNA